MIIEKVKNLEIKDLTPDNTSILADISVKAKGHLFRILTKNFYSNPIGSLVREIASNAWDANIDNNSEKAIIISLMEQDTEDEDEKYYISFKDFGKGMSPDFIKNVYFSFGESTKRDNNEQIGGFGLGKGSILAYSDIAYLTTISDNIKYEYVLSLGEEVPQLDLLNEEECFDDCGTEVKVFIQQKDINSFYYEIENQLAYFQNIYYNSNIRNFDNNYNIFTYKTFKYRTNNSNLHGSEQNKKLTLLLGKVQYPIDFALLNIPPIEMPLSIYFDIGEIQPTPNRENIIYTENTKELIKTKITEFINEVKELHSKELVELDSYFEFYKNVDVSPFFSIIYKDKNYRINICETINSNKSQFVFKYFKDIEFFNNKNSYDNRFNSCFYKVETKINSTNLKHYSELWNIANKDKNVFFNKDDININFDKAQVLNKFNYCTIVKRISLLTKFRDYFRFEYDRRLKCFQSGNYDKPYKFGNEYGVYFKLGEHKKLYELVKQIRKECEEKFIILSPLTNAESREIKDYFKTKKLESTSNVPNVSINGYSYKNYTNREYKLKELKQCRMVVYCFKDEDDNIRELCSAISKIKRSKINSKSYNYYTFIKISKTNEKYIKKMNNTIKIQDFMEGVDCKEFRQIASCLKIEEYLKDLVQHQSSFKVKDFIKTLSNFNEQVGNCLTMLHNYYIKYWNDGDNVSEDFKKAILTIAKDKNLFDNSIDHYFYQLDKWFEGVEIIKKVEINESSIPFVLQLLREKKKKLNLDYYQRFKEISNIELPKKLNVNDTKQLSLSFETIIEHKQTKYKFLTTN